MRWATAAVAATLSICASAAPARDYDPALGWQTRQPSLVCASYFGVKDGLKAAEAHDDAWLKQTGCAIVDGGLRLVPIETPDFDHGDAWRVRLYLPDGQSETVYLKYYYALNFADAGDVQNETEGSRRFKIMEGRYRDMFDKEKKEQTLPYRIIESGPRGKPSLLIGPANYADLGFFCDAARQPRESVEAWIKRDHAALQRWIDHGHKGEPHADAKVPGQEFYCNPPARR